MHRFTRFYQSRRLIAIVTTRRPLLCPIAHFGYGVCFKFCLGQKSSINTTRGMSSSTQQRKDSACDQKQQNKAVGLTESGGLVAHPPIASASSCKTKPRMSRQLKKERKEQKAQQQQQPRMQPGAVNVAQHGKKNVRKIKREQKQQLSVAENLVLTAKRLQFTESVQIMQPQFGEQQLYSKRIRVVTNCLPQHYTQANDSRHKDDNYTTMIYVKPLLVLDLNGILCHRIRRRPGEVTLPMSAYRKTTGSLIATTPIIPRPDLHAFLAYLDQHFCLAIWTSAKSKTSNKLVRELVPEAIARRLLFVWAQNKCQVEKDQQPGSSAVPLAPHEIVYQKDLSEIWKHYPLWNACNTLLMDDSPDKCVAWEENAVHPPPLNGRRVLQMPHEQIAVLSDESNVTRQREFFEQLVQHWRDHPTAHDWDTECEDAAIDNGIGLLRFLKEHAVGHMGWHPTP